MGGRQFWGSAGQGLDCCREEARKGKVYIHIKTAAAAAPTVGILDRPAMTDRPNVRTEMNEQTNERANKKAYVFLKGCTQQAKEASKRTD
jgi:hypothetical protein